MGNMKRGLWLATAVPVGVIGILVIAALIPPHSTDPLADFPAETPSPDAIAEPLLKPPTGALPNRHLTPGVASADVTPANIQITICVVGYTSGHRHDNGKSVRPASSYTTALKRQQIVQYGYRDTKLASYEEDHLIPLELGGDGYAPGNLWPEPYAGTTGARIKDKLENALHRLVCDGQLGLRAAQQAIATNWYAAYQRYG